MPGPHARPGAPASAPAFTLAVCAEMVFLDLPVTERIRRIAGLGFQVFIWDWASKDLDALTARPSCCAPPGSRSRPPGGSAARG
jgi:hypothetical protein